MKSTYYLIILSILCLLYSPTNGQRAGNEVIIVATHPKNLLELEDDYGILVLQISTFYQIEKIMINDQKQSIKAKTRAEIRLPYTLSSKRLNYFVVTVKTIDGSATKVFRLGLKGR